MTGHQRSPDVFLSMPHPCSYLPGKTATTLFIDPRFPLNNEHYATYMRLGFRRSGDLVYRPHCGECRACIPVRIPVAQFVPNRAQRRAWKRNADIRVMPRPPVYMQEHFDLYVRYQAGRHPGGGMDDTDAQKYLSFLTARRMQTVFYEMRAAERLLAVAVVDRLSDGLSAVYTFYDPTESARSLGTLAILWEIEQARHLGLSWLYLGYWIEESSKMSYKVNFRPLEAYRNGRWRIINRPNPATAQEPLSE
jgi:leucyl-tRNA---protein transferase